MNRGANGQASDPPSVTMRPDVQKAVTEGFAKQVCVGELRTHALAEGAGFKAWINQFSNASEAKRLWKCADHSNVNNIMAAELLHMWPHIASLLSHTPASHRNGHQDAWVDVFKRVWIIGSEEWLN